MSVSCRKLTTLSPCFSLLDIWAKLASDVVIKYWQRVLQHFYWRQYSELYCACHSDWQCRNDAAIMLQCREIQSAVYSWRAFWIFPPSPLVFKLLLYRSIKRFQHLSRPVVMQNTPCDSFRKQPNWIRPVVVEVKQQSKVSQRAVKGHPHQER